MREKKFEQWLNDFCINNFHYSYDALTSLSKVNGKIVEVLVTAVQDYFEKWWGTKIFTIAYRMNDAEYEGEGAAYLNYVIAPNFEKAVEAIKGRFKGCRPRKFSSWTLLDEKIYRSYGVEILGVTLPYLGFNTEEEADEER